MSLETILCTEISEGVMRVTLNRPEKHNSLNALMIRELTEVARAMAASPTARAVVLDGAGESFCAGGDLAWMQMQLKADDATRQREARDLFGMLAALDGLPQLLIGAVNGAALGGGVGLASVCDVVIAGPAARFALTETRLGLIPATIAPFLMRRIGAAGLRAYGLHGTMLSAAEAQAIGLVTDCAEEGGMEAVVERHLSRLLASAPGAVAAAKAMFRTLEPLNADEALVTSALAARWRSDEAGEGIAAFFAREAPPWKR